MRHHPYATAYTRTGKVNMLNRKPYRTGKVNMLNRKPYRTAAQKAEARRTAELVNGTHVSSAPVSYHRAPKSKVAA